MPFTPTGRSPYDRPGFDNGGMADVPTTLTQEIVPDCFVVKVEINNNSGGTRTLTVLDGNGVELIPTSNLINKGVITYNAGFGRRMKGGVWWIADAAGCKGYVSGYL